MRSLTVVPPVRQSRPRFRLYGVALGLLLGGYMFFGRPFAYLHVPGIPLYIGEVVLGIGLVQLLGAVGAARRIVLASAPLRVLLVLLVLGAVRLATTFPDAGLEAARDAALLYYALNAVVVATVVRVEPPQLARWLRAYERALPAYLLYAPVSVALHRLYRETVPTVPDSLTPVVDVKPGDVGTFCAIAVAYLWLRSTPATPFLARTRLLWTAVGLAGLLVAGTQSRSGLVSGALILVLALAAARQRGRILVPAVASAAIVLLLAVLLDVRVPLGDRELSPGQLALNVVSVVDDEASGATDAGALTGNVRWRTRYWEDIVNDTLLGDHALAGVGFGTNLAVRYDLQTPGGQQGLRNAHNSHLSLLAWAGAPALALWLLFWGLLAGAATRMAARMRRHAGAPHPWLLAWVAAALGGILCNAVFDPTLEGPQIALWTWTLAGVATQAARFPLIAALGSWDAPTSDERPAVRGGAVSAAARRAA